MKNAKISFCNCVSYYYYSFLLAIESTTAAITLNGFDDQERNLTFVKTNIQV